MIPQSMANLNFYRWEGERESTIVGPLLNETDQCPANQQLNWGRSEHIICVLDV